MSDSPANRGPVRMGVIVPGEFEPWQRACLDDLAAGGHAEVVAWISKEAPPPGAPDGEGFTLEASGLCVAEPDRERLGALGLEVLLYLGEGSAPEAFSAFAARGLWAFEHEGSPAGHHAARRGDFVTTAVFVQIPSEAKSPRIELRRGSLGTVRWSAGRNRRKLLSECARWPALACAEIRAGLDHARVAEPSPRPLETSPGPPRRLTDMARALPRLAAHLWRRATRVDLWRVGVVDAPIHSLLEGPVPPVRWMPAKGRLRLDADPFGLERDGELHVFYEGLEHRDGRGFLATRPVEDGGFGEERVILREPFHLSYPFLFEHGGETFCVPESWEAGEVALYRCLDFPGRWEKAATLLPGYPGIDSTLVFHGGRFWMWSTRKGDGHDARLDLFFADELTGPWTPHPRNPVKIDVRSARGGGTPFVHGGDLYRPGQDYSRKQEERLTLNRVTVLSETDYGEETVRVLEPLGKGPRPDKLHTLSSAGGRTLIDGCREVSVLTSLTLLRFKARRFLGR